MKDQAEAGDSKQISLTGRVALADRIQRALEELRQRQGRVTYAQVAAKSGGLITEGAITNLLAKQVGNPKILTLYGLARALEIDPQELFEAALGIEEPAGVRGSRFWDLYDEFQQIDNQAHLQLANEMLEGVFRAVRGFPKKKKKADSSSRSAAVRNSQ